MPGGTSPVNESFDPPLRLIWKAELLDPKVAKFEIPAPDLPLCSFSAPPLLRQFPHCQSGLSMCKHLGLRYL
jgi:hypothetical protein